jgi:hypothetical protein
MANDTVANDIMADEWTQETVLEQRPQTISVSLNGQVVEAQILKFEDQPETTIQIGDDLFGTTWPEIIEAHNANRPLEIIPNPDHFQLRD